MTKIDCPYHRNLRPRLYCPWCIKAESDNRLNTPDEIESISRDQTDDQTDDDEGE